jgi:casein kinase 1
MASSIVSSNTVANRYVVGRQVGEGSFGIVFKGTNLLNQQRVAIKFESQKNGPPQLRNEYYAYKALAGCRKSSQRPYC